MADDFISNLAQGLRGAAGVLNPAIQAQNAQQDFYRQQQQDQHRQAMIEQTIRGIENGSIDPVQGQATLQRLGYAGAPIGISQSAKNALGLEAERAAQVKRLERIEADATSEKAATAQGLDAVDALRSSVGQMVPKWNPDGTTVKDATGKDAMVPITEDQVKPAMQDVARRYAPAVVRNKALEQLVTPDKVAPEKTDVLETLNNYRAKTMEMPDSAEKTRILKGIDDRIKKESQTASQIVPPIHIGMGDPPERLTPEGMKAKVNLIRNGLTLPRTFRGQIDNSSLNTMGAEDAASGGDAAKDIYKNKAEGASIRNAESRFTSGVQGNTIRSIQVAENHLKTLEELAGAMKNSDLVLFNKVRNMYREQTGSELPTNMNAAAAIVGQEVVKGVVGSTSSAEERMAAAKAFGEAKGPEQIFGATRTVRSLLQGQVKGLRNQYKAATKKDDFNTRFGFDESGYPSEDKSSSSVSNKPDPLGIR